VTSARSAGAVPAAPYPICSTCGAVAAEEMPLTWSAAVEGGRRQWTCDRCAREHVRSIEAKLDSSWW
jgi:hypothetical protein